jgi:uncharacterized protein YmfQ (DUF2313 family)
MSNRDTALAMYRLLPTGDAWPDYQEDTEIKKLITGMSKSMDDFVVTVKDTMSQYYPGQPEIFMTDWEEVLALPKCGQVGQSIQTRLSQILAMFRISPYSNAQFFTDIAEVFGYTVIVGYQPATITISGASGAPGWNGVYVPAGIVGGRLQFSEDGTTSAVKVVLWSGTHWWMLNEFGDTDFIAPDNTLITPSLTNWSPLEAAGPAPSLSFPVNPDPFKITVQVESVESILFRAGLSSVGDPLEEIQVGILECILNFFKQSHTYLEFVVAP